MQSLVFLEVFSNEDFPSLLPQCAQYGILHFGDTAFSPDRRRLNCSFLLWCHPQNWAWSKACWANLYQGKGERHCAKISGWKIWIWQGGIMHTPWHQWVFVSGIFSLVSPAPSPTIPSPHSVLYLHWQIPSVLLSCPWPPPLSAHWPGHSQSWIPTVPCSLLHTRIVPSIRQSSGSFKGKNRSWSLNLMYQKTWLQFIGLNRVEGNFTCSFSPLLHLLFMSFLPAVRHWEALVIIQASSCLPPASEIRKRRQMGH